LSHEPSDIINLTVALFAGPGRKELDTLGGVSQFNLLQISGPEHTEDIGSDEQIGVSIQYTAGVAMNTHEAVEAEITNL
jgi:hypothetical protein